MLIEYEYYGKPENWDKWGFSIAVVNYNCPKCLAPKEHCCVTPSGKKAWPPHNQRCMLLTPEEINQTRIVVNAQPLIEKMREGVKIDEKYRKEYID
jgi:hypothetical protein